MRHLLELPARRRRFGASMLAVATTVWFAEPGRAQTPADSLVAVRVAVTTSDRPLEGALVRSERASATTDPDGIALLRLAPGPRLIVVARIGYRPDSLAFRVDGDTTIAVALERVETELEELIVSASRGERRVEDTPIRVEVIDEEEIAEKVTMTPGDIVMMLNETSGLRVQSTSPSLGGASVRVQGLSGRYTLLLADGLPLYGGQGGALGLLQVPPIDLGRVEVIKGSASALYGSAALGGIVDLLSRRPGNERELSLVLNQTTRGGSDAAFFGAAPLSEHAGLTILASGHRQRRNDLDGDGWTDMPGYRRAVLRPRFFFDDGAGRSAFVTAGFTAEQRDGGTLAGSVAPDGRVYREALRTNRGDIGTVARWTLPDSGSLGGATISLRASAMEQRHEHVFGAIRERDRHRTLFGELTAALPRGRATYVAGIALEHDRYRAEDVAGFDYGYSIPGIFGQIDVDPVDWLALSASGRVDIHDRYGTVVNPRVSALLRPAREGWLSGWSARLSAGTGAFAPTPFTERTDVTGLTPLAPLTGLVTERAFTAALDVGGPIATGFGRVELNGTLFGSEVRHPLRERDLSTTTPDGAGRFELINADGAARVWGVEALVRVVRELSPVASVERAIRLTATYTHLRGTECNDPGAGSGCSRRPIPLNPRHAAGMVASYEEEGRTRVGLELYYTGRQALDRNPFRAESRPYVVMGILAERQFGRIRVFLNAENLGNVRQTRIDPLVLPARGEGGRWTTDVWSLLEGRTFNGGVRLTL